MKEFFKPTKVKFFALILIIGIFVIGGLLISKYVFIEEEESKIKVSMPQPDNWDYAYESPDELVAQHVSNFLLSKDAASEQWLREQLSIDQTENEKLKDHFNNRDYFRDKYNVREEIILSLCTQPDKAYSLIQETFYITETYSEGVINNYPVEEAAQCMIRSKLYREDAIRFLQNLLTDNSQVYAVKVAAAEALSDIGDEGSISVIQEALEQQTNKYAIRYLKKSIKRIKKEDDLPFIDYSLSGGIKLNFSEDDIKEIRFINWDDSIIIQFSENDFSTILNYTEKGKKSWADETMQMNMLYIILQDGNTIDLYYDNESSADVDYFVYDYYDRYYNPQEKLYVIFESKELSDFIEQKLEEQE